VGRDRADQTGPPQSSRRRLTCSPVPRRWPNPEAARTSRRRRAAHGDGDGAGAPRDGRARVGRGGVPEGNPAGARPLLPHPLPRRLLRPRRRRGPRRPPRGRL
jgi:hypothetical protein